MVGEGRAVLQQLQIVVVVEGNVRRSKEERKKARSTHDSAMPYLRYRYLISIIMATCMGLNRNDVTGSTDFQLQIK